MNIIYGLLGLGLAYGLVRYREYIGQALGRVEWADKWIGGVYNLVVLVAIGLAIFSLLMIFGLEEIIFGNLKGETSL